MNGDIQIWNVVEGRVTELKIKNMVVCVSTTKPEDVDPVEVAKIFLETFNVSKRVRYIQTSREDDTTRTNGAPRIDSNTKKQLIECENDIIEKTNGINILKSCLDKIYSRYANSEFTNDDVAYTFTNIIGFGGVRVSEHINYLKTHGFLDSRSDGCKTIHRFLKRWGYKVSEPIAPSESKKMMSSTTSQENNSLIINQNVLSREYDYPIRENVVLMMLDVFKDSSGFKSRDVWEQLSIRGIKKSQDYFVTHIRYLKDKGVCAQTVSGRKNARYMFTQLAYNDVPHDRVVDCCAFGSDFGPDVVVKPLHTNAYFDREELRKRRALELNTIRKG